MKQQAAQTRAQLEQQVAQTRAQLEQQAKQKTIEYAVKIAQLEQQAEQRQRETLCTNIITNIITVLQSRFAADNTTYAIIRRLLATETDPERLQALFNAAVTIGSLADFQNMVVFPQGNGSV
ncbi:MAG: hypothetical protein HC837_09995 [Chloroflexaceae bacterium]|nr:hypothetical protein [Chloroflexaceae bacterium]